jgi:hypothetical protein
MNEDAGVRAMKAPMLQGRARHRLCHPTPSHLACVSLPLRVGTSWNSCMPARTCYAT